MPTALLRLSLGALAAALLAMPASAGADSLVYVDSAGHLSIANPDGSAAHTVISDTGWTFPSEADDGTIAALAPSGAIGVMDQFGALRSGVPTPAFVSDFDVTMFPRISPDGSKVAYGNLDPSDGATVYWAPTSGTTQLHPGQTLGQEDMTAPSWIDSTHMLLTHYGEPLTDTQKQLYTYTAGGGDNTEAAWGTDPYAPTFMNGDSWEATGFAAAINRQQTAVAVALDDSADHGGTTQNAVIDMFAVSGTPPAMQTANGCRFTLQSPGGDDDTTANDTVANPDEISPSFSPAGNALAFATDAGVWVMTLPTSFSTCAGGTIRLAIPGGSCPYWGAGDVQAPPVPPAAGGTPPPPTNPAPPAKPAPPAPAPATPIAGPRAVFSLPHRLHARKKATFSAAKSTGRIVRYRWSFGDRHSASGKVVKHAFKRRGTYTVTLTVTDADGRTATAKRRVKVRR